MNHRHQPSTTAAADGLQLGSGLRRIACLAALLFIFVAGVRAANYVITIYDGCKLKNSDLDAINVLGILGQVGWSGSGNVRTLFTPNPPTELFDYNQSTLVCSVPTTITPANDITFPVAAYRVMFEQAFPGLYYITLYDNIVIQFQVAVNKLNFPDTNFRNWVKAQSYGSDGILTKAEIAAVTKINVSDKSISSLKGIEYFTALTYLDCYYNKLTALDVSNNTKLTYLDCEFNQLTTLEVSNNTKLTYLDCRYNDLTVLDVSNNTALYYLNCRDNQLTSLDVSGCTKLESLFCYYNNLTTLDVSKNTALKELYCSGNQIRGKGMTDLVKSLPDRSPALEEGELGVYRDETPAGNLMTPKQVEVATSKNWSVLRYDADNWVWVDYEGEPADGIEISEDNFPDENFREYVGSKTIDKDEDGYLSDDEIAAVTRIYVESKSIASLKGIEYFTALEELNCHGNQLTTLDVSNNTALTELHCDNNGLTELDVSNNTALTWLSCVNNQLTSLDVTNCTALTELKCYQNQLTTLDVLSCTALRYLYCYENQIRGKGMTDLVKSLPDRSSASEEGELQVYCDETPAGNLMTPGQVEIAKSMNWSAKKYHVGVNMWVPYEGETVPGDANGDGEVDALDVDCLRDYVLGLDPQPFSFESANLNGDSAVDIQDLTQLIEILLKR